MGARKSEDKVLTPTDRSEFTGEAWLQEAGKDG